METNKYEQVIKDAQYRKGLSIAFFNATNNASEIVKLIYADHPQSNLEVIKKDISFWRDWLLEEHKDYYVKVIAGIGLNFDVKETLKKFDSVETLDDLKSVWLSLTQDERQNQEVVAVKNKLRIKYEKS